MNFVVFRVVCAVMCLIINTFTLFVFLGRHARLFLSITTIASFVCFSGGVRGYFQLPLLSRVVFFGWRVCFFNYYYYYDFCFFFFGWRARSFLKYYQYHEFCVFSVGVRGYF